MYKIYRVVDNTNGNVYIGITINRLCDRLAQHKCYKNCISRDIINNGDYEIILIEETDDKTRERYWIENTECINERIPGRTKKEYYQDNIEKTKKYKKQWYQDNKDLDKQKEYYELNAESIKAQETKRRNFRKSWGGDERRHNNLLKIDPTLFI